MTNYGLFIRKFRIERNLRLCNMAHDLEMSASYMSSIEHGLSATPLYLEDKIISAYTLDSDSRKALHEAIMTSQLCYNISTKNDALTHRMMGLMRDKINLMTDLTKNKVIDILENIRG